jgi:hypothetical protein
MNNIIVDGCGSLEERSHENYAPARAVVLIVPRVVRRARLQAESAVHARIESRQLASER